MNSLEELGYAGLLPPDLIMVVVEQYDKTVTRLVSQATDIYTVRGEVTGQVREHNHQPPDVAPIVKSDENRLVSPLFF